MRPVTTMPVDRPAATTPKPWTWRRYVGIQESTATWASMPTKAKPTARSQKSRSRARFRIRPRAARGAGGMGGSPRATARPRLTATTGSGEERRREADRREEGRESQERENLPGADPRLREAHRPAAKRIRESRERVRDGRRVEAPASHSHQEAGQDGERVAVRQCERCGACCGQAEPDQHQPPASDAVGQEARQELGEPVGKRVGAHHVAGRRVVGAVAAAQLLDEGDRTDPHRVVEREQAAQHEKHGPGGPGAVTLARHRVSIAVYHLRSSPIETSIERDTEREWR